jgi:hypothetical protein
MSFLEKDECAFSGVFARMKNCESMPFPGSEVCPNKLLYNVEIICNLIARKRACENQSLQLFSYSKIHRWTLIPGSKLNHIPNV